MTFRLESNALQEYGRYLYRYALQHVRDADVAHDLVQDTFVAALEGGCRFEGRSAMRTWLVGILKHKIADSFRERLRAPVSVDALADADSGAASGVEVAERLAGAAPAAHEPANVEARRRFWEACQARLERMPAQAARAFLMADVLGYESAQVCRALGITSANLWTTLHRARRRLQSELAGLRPA